jgi:signal peptidase I
LVDGRHPPSPRACDTPTISIRDPQTNEDVVLGCAVEEYGDGSYSVLRAFVSPEPSTKALGEPGRWYLVSDDRHIHLDSRDFGQVDSATCEHIVFRLLGANGFADREKRLSIIW